MSEPKELKEIVRQLLRDELRVKVITEYDGPVIDSIEIQLYLHDELIAKHASYLGFPLKKEHGI